MQNKPGGRKRDVKRGSTGKNVAKKKGTPLKKGATSRRLSASGSGVKKSKSQGSTVVEVKRQLWKKSTRPRRSAAAAAMVIDSKTGAPAKKSLTKATANRMASHLGTKLFISNLDFKVTSDDVRELFATIGPLVSSSVHYKRSGSSAGTAEAVFHSRADAVKAQQRYGNVQLDGRPMKIELIEQISAPMPSERTLTSGIVVTRRNVSRKNVPSRRGRNSGNRRPVKSGNAMQE